MLIYQEEIRDNKKCFDRILESPTHKNERSIEVILRFDQKFGG